MSKSIKAVAANAPYNNVASKKQAVKDAVQKRKDRRLKRTLWTGE